MSQFVDITYHLKMTTHHHQHQCSVCLTGVLLRRAQQAMLASDLAKNSESFSPGGDFQHYSADNELTMANKIQAENHFSNEVEVHSEMYNTT